MGNERARPCDRKEDWKGISLGSDQTRIRLNRHRDLVFSILSMRVWWYMLPVIL